MVGDGADAFLPEHQNLARPDFPDELRADDVQRAALGRDDVRAVHALAVAERMEAVFVPRGDHLGGRHHHQRVCAPDAVHRAVDRLLDGRGGQALLGDDIGDDLRIARGVKDGALQFQFLPQFRRIHQISVVCDRHRALVVIDDDGLSVSPSGRPGRAVAHMAERHVALPQPLERIRREYVVYDPRILMRRENPVVVDDDPAGLLPAVLQGEKPVIGDVGDILRLGAVNAENAAFFVDLAHIRLFSQKAF